MTANRMFANTSEERHDDSNIQVHCSNAAYDSPSMLFRAYIVGTYRAYRHSLAVSPSPTRGCCIHAAPVPVLST